MKKILLGAIIFLLLLIGLVSFASAADVVEEETMKISGSAVSVLNDVMDYKTPLIILSLIILGLTVFAVGVLIIRRQKNE